MTGVTFMPGERHPAIILLRLDEREHALLFEPTLQRPHFTPPRPVPRRCHSFDIALMLTIASSARLPTYRTSITPPNARLLGGGAGYFRHTKRARPSFSRACSRKICACLAAAPCAFPRFDAISKRHHFHTLRRFWRALRRHLIHFPWRRP